MIMPIRVFMFTLLLVFSNNVLSKSTKFDSFTFLDSYEKSSDLKNEPVIISEINSDKIENELKNIAIALNETEKQTRPTEKLNDNITEKQWVTSNGDLIIHQISKSKLIMAKMLELKNGNVLNQINDESGQIKELQYRTKAGSVYAIVFHKNGKPSLKRHRINGKVYNIELDKNGNISSGWVHDGKNRRQLQL